MALSPRTIRIIVALLISGGFIAAGYVFSSPFLPTFAGASGTDELLAAYAKKDSDSDGLPDWQEALYGTDPANAHSADPTLTDAEAVAKGLVQPRFESESLPVESGVAAEDFEGPGPAPGSLTEQFAREFFTQYMSSSQGEPSLSKENVDVFVDNELAKLRETRTAFTRNNISVSGSGQAALSIYASSMASMMRTNAVSEGEDELTSLHKAVIEGDLAALKRLSEIAKTYRDSAEAAKRISAPQEVADAHAQLLNAFSTLGEAIDDMAAYKEDPVRTFLGIDMYSGAATDLIESLVAINKAFVAAGVTPAQGNAGHYFYALTEQAAAIPGASSL